MEPATITIEHPDVPGEPMIINKSDFDPAIHKPYEPSAPTSDGDREPETEDAKPKAKTKK